MLSDPLSIVGIRINGGGKNRLAVTTRDFKQFIVSDKDTVHQLANGAWVAVEHKFDSDEIEGLASLEQVQDGNTFLPGIGHVSLRGGRFTQVYIDLGARNV